MASGRFPARGRSWRRLLVIASALAAGAPLLPHPAAAVPPAAAPDAVTSDAAAPDDRGSGEVVTGSVRVRAADGVPLAARVYRPARPGPHPLVVMPGAWFHAPPDAVVLDRRLRALAASGYVVVGYDPRGLRRSGGHVDLAGPADVDDASRVIDWALAHTPADPARVGMLAASYGAGVSLNTAAFDPRVRAVAALSGWADFADGYVRNGTRAAPMGTYQELIGRIDGRFGPGTEAGLAALRRGGDTPPAWAAQRSPRTHVARLNQRRTAVLMVNEWDDPLVPAGQTGVFLDALRGPRQLRMYPGGHGDSNSLTSDLSGGPGVWEHAVRWMDRHVRGTAPRGPAEPPVVLQSRTGGAPEHYPSWSALRRAARSVPLTPAGGGTRVSLTAGLPSAAESGAFPVAGSADRAGVRQSTLLPLLSAPASAVATSAPLTGRRALRGAPVVTTRLTPTAPDGTVIGYLYDVDPLGRARLLTHAPYSFSGRAEPGPFEVRIPMPATAWDVPAGHRLAVVLDTVDHRYASDNPIGARLGVDVSATRLVAPLFPRPGG
ncbi:alpha/beta fold hydrolase [Streptomyces sp. HMX112]|uniref:alpha/beta fold hydrolase n=1 Tax=Streptomyces sp. HMX112 TaxID=3390850 RepID=UPI003A7FD526